MKAMDEEGTVSRMCRSHVCTATKRKERDKKIKNCGRMQALGELSEHSAKENKTIVGVSFQEEEKIGRSYSAVQHLLYARFFLQQPACRCARNRSYLWAYYFAEVGGWGYF